MAAIRALFSTAIAFVVAACKGSTTPLASTPEHALDSKVKSFSCDSYPGREHFAEMCTVDLSAILKAVSEDITIECYGELSYTQVSGGRVNSLQQGFYFKVGMTRANYERQFALPEFVYFPRSYEALDPSLAWHKCRIGEKSESTAVATH